MENTPELHDFGRFAPDDWHVDSDGYVAIFGGFRVVAPSTVFRVTDTVTHDVIVDTDAEVRIDVNGIPLTQLGDEQ